MNKLLSINRSFVSFMQKYSWFFQSFFAFTAGTSVALIDAHLQKGLELTLPMWLHIIMLILLGWASVDFMLLTRKKLKKE
jgi:hypothetical protein